MSLYVPPDISDLITVLLLSLVSALISICRRIVSGQAYSAFSMITEFVTAIFCGYLMHTMYPDLAPHVPAFLNETVVVAFAAHSGGRIMQAIERALITKVTKLSM